MLSLARKPGQSVILHHPEIGQIRVMVIKREEHGGLRIGIEAPQSVKILREELLDRVWDRKLKEENTEVKDAC
jgi:carbon storage regulator CsrA